jgi:hypothetical protein
MQLFLAAVPMAPMSEELSPPPLPAVKGDRKIRVCSDCSQNKPYQILALSKFCQFGNIAKFWQDFLFIYQSLVRN